jgi:TPR repeat protein
MLFNSIAQEKKESGNRHIGKKEYHEALLCYEEALRCDPKMKEAWLNKGIAHHHLNQLSEAKAAFEAALIIAPEYQKAKDNLNVVQARLWMAEGRYQNAYQLLNKCPRTARVEHSLIQVSNQFKATVFFGRVDLKLTAMNEVKILSIGYGMRSALRANAVDTLSTALASLGLPVTVVGKPGRMLVNPYSEVTEFIKKHGIVEKQEIDFSSIRDYSGIYCSQAYDPGLYGNILSLQDNALAEVILGEKVLMHRLFEAVPSYRPVAKVIPHHYSPGLAQQIIQDIPSQLYVIKRSDLDKSQGVWLVRKNQLDKVLVFLLEPNLEKSLFLCDNYLRQHNSKPEDVLFYINLLISWHGSLSTSSIVEAYTPSSTLNIAGKSYDPTMRVSFLVIRDNNAIQFKPLSAYWQLPQETMGHDNLHLSRVAELGGGKNDPGSIVDVAPKDLACVYEQLSVALPQVFQTLFTFNLDSYLQKLLTSLSTEQRTHANDITLRMAHALGQYGYMHAALEALTSIEKDYHRPYKIHHERGLIYHCSRLYDQAIEQFTTALKHEVMFATHFRRGLAYYALGKLDEAVKDLAEAAREPGNVYFRDCYEQARRELQKTTTPQTCPSVNPGAKKSIDLHGLSVQDAKKKVQETLQSAREERFDNLTIITGIGNHVNSNGTRGVLFNVLPKWLKQSSMQPEIDNITQDRGAYVVQFNFNEELKSAKAAISEQIKKLIIPEEIAAHLVKLEQESQAGHVESQWCLGIHYQEGIGTMQDITKGLHWITKAAESLVDAQIYLGQIAYDAKEYKNALSWFNKAEKQGSQDAAFYIGSMYWLGQGVIKNDKRAISYLTKAARNATVSPITIAAAHNLADIYYTGFGTIECNLPWAAEYYFIAAKENCVPAQVKLAKQYFYGWGVEVDDSKAFYWFKQAALAGEVVAEYYTGFCYEQGRGVSESLEAALHWYTKSALKGDLDAQFKLAYSFLTGNLGKKNRIEGLTQFEALVEKEHPASLYVLGGYLLSEASTEVIPRAIQLLTRAGELKEVHAPGYLAQLYLLGQQCPINREKAMHWAREALEWGKVEPEEFFQIALHLELQNENNCSTQESIACFTRAAQLGFVRAQHLLALTYLEGDAYTPQDISKAVSLLEQAAQQNCREAQYLFAKLHSGENGYLPKNDEKFFYYMQQAALDENLIDAQIGLGYCYLDGMGVKKNRAKAIQLFEKAAQKGNAFAQLKVGHLLLDGDRKKAMQYFTLAAEQDEVEAQFYLGGALMSHMKGEQFGEGVYWFHRAALQGHPKALDFFRQSYMSGFKEAVDQQLIVHYRNHHHSATVPSIETLINQSIDSLSVSSVSPRGR